MLDEPTADHTSRDGHPVMPRGVVSDELFRLLVASVRDYAIFLLDRHGYVTTWNLGAERIKGYIADEIIGRHFSKFYVEDEARSGKCEHELEEATRVGRFEDEGWRVRKDGSRFWANVVITAVRDGSGDLLGFAKVTRDLTERKRSEDERAARVAAEHANHIKDQFLAMLGHELRNPLAPIVTALQLIKLRDDRPSRRELSIIERQVDHMVHLVDDLLDVSRITSGRVALSRAHVDLRDVLAKAIEATSPAFEKKHHHLDIRAPRHPCIVDADEARLTQVVVNLLNNAAKYTGPGGHVAATVIVADDHCCIEVRDDGIGIAPDLLPRIFDLFVQGDQAGARAGGLGLGLAIVRSLVQLHGGTIDVHSDGADTGSRFTVRLPAVVKAAERAAAATPPPFPTASSRQCILLVDDNEDARMLLGEILRSLGHEVIAAGDGEAALEAVRTSRPDVAILDIGLPTMNGYELAVKLRETLADPPFLIALTGYGQAADRARGQTAGFDRFLVKPIDIRNLLTTIDGVARG